MFHDEEVAMRSLQKSSPNSCCNGGFHALAMMTGLDEPEPSGLMKLDALERFRGHSIFSKGADNKSGLSAGDGIAKLLQLAFGSDPVAIVGRGILIEHTSMGGF